MRYLSLFSGVEAASVAWMRYGWEPLAFAEIDAFPSAVLAQRFPDVPNLGDVCKVDWKEFYEEYGAVELLVGGSPCFTAGTLVLCESGFKPIEQVEVGDRVVTHKGNLKRVLKTGSKTADTIVLKGQGSVGIECTPNHPFYAREKRRVWDNSRREYIMETQPESRWVEAKDMQGEFWLNVCDVKKLPIPPFPESGRGKKGFGYIDGFEFTDAFFYFVGRWLGDGWANAHRRKGRKESFMKRVYVCCSHDEADVLETVLSRSGLHFGRVDSGSTERFTCSSTQLHDWLIGNFGVHADGKNIPAWCMGMKKSFKRALLNGYIDADGCKFDNGYQSTTINRKLSLGIKMLAGSLGMASSVSKSVNSRQAVIEGREVNERPNYLSHHYESTRSSFFADGGFYGKVKHVEPGRESVTVYNLEVEDDNSYTADGIAVHNCQSFSIAGGRAGLQGESGLMFEYIRAIRDLVHASEGKYPRYIIWENVPGALSSERGAAFGQLLAELDELGYGLAWRVLDAQFCRVCDGSPGGFFGPVAQRRRRVFLVGVLGSPHAAEILFERESLRGDNPSSREARKSLAGDPAESPGAGNCAGFKWYAGAKAGSIGYGVDTSPTIAVSDSHVPGVLTPWDVQSKRIMSVDGTCPTLPSGTGEGANIQPCVMQPVISVSTANTNSNGSNINTEEVSYTLDGANSNAIAFAQNTRDEVRYIGGDGQVIGALAAQPGMKQTSYVMTDVTSHGAIEEDMAGTITAHAAKNAPVLAHAKAIDCRNLELKEDVSGTLQAKENGGYSLNYQNPVIVRTEPQQEGAQ